LIWDSNGKVLGNSFIREEKKGEERRGEERRRSLEG